MKEMQFADYRRWLPVKYPEGRPVMSHAGVAMEQSQEIRDLEAEVQRLQGFFLAYPRDRIGWICSVCHLWNEPRVQSGMWFCTHSHVGLDTL